MTIKTATTTCVAFTVLCGAGARAEVLSVNLLDESDQPTGVRMEILDELGTTQVPETAMPIDMRCAGQPVPDEAPACATGFRRDNFLDNPHTGTRQFYVHGAFVIDLPPGRYSITAYKGIEYTVEHLELEIGAQPRSCNQITLRMKRWAHLAREGWFSADDHLHIARTSPEDNDYLTTWMRAEDLNVANLIQMGTQRRFDITPQFAFGAPGTHQSGDTLLLSGQEHPRTHLLGHSLILGADAPIDLRSTYSVYRNFFQLAQKLGGVNGYAHFGVGAAANGLAVDGPSGLLSFLEVLQDEYPEYSMWYQLLNLGIPIAPTAGTDFPCPSWSVPGRERFYTKVEGGLSRESWLAGVRAGRTFVTNGPLLELHVEGAEIGDRISLAGPDTVRVRGVVRFDPSRDRIEAVSLVQNGVAAPLDVRTRSAGVLEVSASLRLEESAWLALRASGHKIGEAPLHPMPHSESEYAIGNTFSCGSATLEREKYAAGHGVRPSEAHTGAIYVDVSRTAAVSHQTGSRRIALDWLARLDELEARLQDDNLWSEPLPLGLLENSDGVDLKDLTRNRDELLQLIAGARAYFQGLLE